MIVIAHSDLEKLYLDCNELYNWCQKCNVKGFVQNFSNWTSKNEFIDNFI